MNLRVLKDDHDGLLFDVDNLYTTQLELKAVYLHTPSLYDRVFAIHPPVAARAHEASMEALELIIDTLQADYPGLVARDGVGDDDRLVNIATGRYWRMAEEDLAILLPVATGVASQYVLAAAAVCFADQWAVGDKIGASLGSIHAPVPHYPRIAKSVDQFFAGLQVGGARVRYNFTFCERPDLHIEGPPTASDCPLPPTRLPHALYVRVERQALLRLPRAGAVLFTIRTYRQDVRDIPRRHHAAVLAALDPAARSTPLSAHQKEAYRERVRGIFAGGRE